jgi:hypothetical protein
MYCDVYIGCKRGEGKDGVQKEVVVVEKGGLVRGWVIEERTQAGSDGEGEDVE